MVKVVVLMENTACEPQFDAEHGLSLYIETKRHKILFDSGQSVDFAENASRLGIDLKEVDLAVLSHGHYDHGGGLARFLELNTHAPVYLSSYAFGQYYNGAKKYIGIAQELKKSGRLIFTEDELKIDEELTLCSCNHQKNVRPIDSAGLTEKLQNTEEHFVPDSFLHEQYLVLWDEGRKMVFSGCSHKGILNITEWMKPDIFVGGFHFMKEEIKEGKNAVLDEAAAKLSGYDTDYYTCHCTGVEQYQYLKERMGERLTYISAGQTLLL